MGKIVCLLIATICFLRAEYVTGANSVRSLVGGYEANATSKSKNSRIPSRILENNQSKITKKQTRIPQNNQSKIPQNNSTLKKLEIPKIQKSIISAGKSDEFIFWAKFFTTNNMLSTRVLSISKAMKKSDESEFVRFCELRIPRNFGESELEYFKSNEDALADCFTRSPFVALEYSKYAQNGAKAGANLKTNITQIPLHFIAIFKPFGAIIFAKIEK